MNEEVQLFTNDKLDLKVRTIQNQDGSILVNAEDTARGFGWIQVETKGDKIYSTIKWARMNKFIKELGFDHKCTKGDFIPESLFYLLGMKAKNEVAQEFQKWIAIEVIPQIRRTGGYIPIKEEDDEKTLLSKALIVAQRTIEQKDSLIQAQNKQLEEQKSFVDFVKTIETSKDSLEVGQFIKIVNDKEIDLGRNGFFCWLREKGYLNKRNEPYQRYIDQELFEVREGYYYQGKETKLSLTTLITAKGQRYFVNKLREEFCKNKIND